MFELKCKYQNVKQKSPTDLFFMVHVVHNHPFHAHPMFWPSGVIKCCQSTSYIWPLVFHLFTLAMRHQVLKWALFFFSFVVVFVCLFVLWCFFCVCVCVCFFFWGGGDFWSYADWVAHRQCVINVIWRRTKYGLVECTLLPGSMDCL